MSTVNGFQVGNEVLKYNYESLENYNTPNFSTSSSTQYAVGDYVTYQGKLYKCTTATTGGTWVSGSWELAILSDDLQSLGSEVEDLNRQISDVESAVTAISQAPSLSWTVGRGISATGTISSNPYTALTDLMPCLSGDVIVNNTPDKDSNNVYVALFVATYAGDTFVERVAVSHGNSFTMGNSITQFRLQFGRASASGVTFQNSDLNMLDLEFHFKGVPLQTYNRDMKEMIHGYSPMITTVDRLNAATGNSKSANDFPINSIVCVGQTGLGLTDYPLFSGNGLGVYMTYQHINGASNGECQFFVCGTGSATRWKVSGNWTDWVSTVEETYFVGGNSGNNSLTSLLIDLKDNEHKKTIYIYPGTYDVFAEYQAEVTAGRLSVPDDDIDVSNYFYPYNAFVPNNTKLIGLGDVTLQFTPSSTDITYGESRTWAPLNTLGAVEIENIEIVAKNCRYAIHDDTHSNYYNTIHKYKNVRAKYTLGDTKDGQQLGLNSTIGFGFGDGCNFVFDSCVFEFSGSGNHGVFYGHGRSGTTKTTGSVIVKDSAIIASDSTNNRVIWLQTLSKTITNRIDTLFSNCYITAGSLNFNLNDAETVQSFDVTMLKSGTLPVVYSGSGSSSNDPYTVKVYT